MSNVQIEKKLTVPQPSSNWKLNDKLNFKYQFSTLIFLYLCYIFCNPKTIFAHQINMNITGISYHIGNYSYPNAPRGLDKNGIFILNPGIGLGWDFRSIKRTNGFSLISQAIYFRDCGNRGVAMLGGGTRYRYFFNNQFSGDINLLVTLSAWETWKANKYKYSILPFILLGANYHFKNDITLGTNFTLMPNTPNFNGAFWILFGTLQISFPIFN